MTIVIGAGDATGSAIARRFAREGYVACLTRRSADKLQPLVEEIRAAGGEAHGVASDARKEEQVAELLEHIESQLGQRAVQHPGRDGPQALVSLGNGLFFGIPDQPGRRQAHGAPPARHDPLHGGHGSPAGCRQLCRDRRGQARTAGAVRNNFATRYAEKDQDGILPPEHIADAYWYLHSQPRDAWSFELDLRPWMERW